MLMIIFAEIVQKAAKIAALIQLAQNVLITIF